MEKSITLKNQLSELEKLTDFLDGVIEELELGASLGMSIQLALEEAVANIIMYAYPIDSECDFAVKALSDTRGLSFWIMDHGMPFDPTILPDADVTLSAEDREIGGLGIYLVRQIMDEVSYTRLGDENQLYMRKKI
ncbi:MAG: ATP-binding protein [Phocaeicola sp.]